MKIKKKMLKILKQQAHINFEILIYIILIIIKSYNLNSASPKVDNKILNLSKDDI